jgi:hypothetical protein
MKFDVTPGGGATSGCKSVVLAIFTSRALRAKVSLPVAQFPSKIRQRNGVTSRA